MASVKTLEAINRYREAFKNSNGYYPTMRENRGWVRVGESEYDQSYRATELNKMAERIEQRLRFPVDKDKEAIDKFVEWIGQKEKYARNEHDVWAIDTDDMIQHQKTTPLTTWKKYIKKDAIELFLNKLFEECGRSSYEMERIMRDFALGGSGFFKNTEELNEYKSRIRQLEKNNMDLQEKLEYAMDDLSTKKRVIRREQNKVLIHEQNIEKLKKDIETIKKNSVLFTMDDIDFMNTEDDTREDIPF